MTTTEKKARPTNKKRQVDQARQSNNQTISDYQSNIKCNGENIDAGLGAGVRSDHPVRVCRRNRYEKLPPFTKLITRPSRWGNPYKCEPTTEGRETAVKAYETDLIAGRLAVTVEDVRRELRGWNLACACPVGEPCHGDVLLRIANEGKPGSDHASRARAVHRGVGQIMQKVIDLMNDTYRNSKTWRSLCRAFDHMGRAQVDLDDAAWSIAGDVKRKQPRFIEDEARIEHLLDDAINEGVELDCGEVR